MAILLNALLVAGTDTEVGKTVLTSALIAYWQRAFPQRSVGVLKPVQAGPGDRELYQRLFFPDLTLEALNPQYFQAPLAPPLAAALEQRQIDLAQVWQTLAALVQRHPWVLVEGLGGLGSPVTEELTVAALATAWGLPVVLVVPVKLGAIAQAVANVALARQEQLDLRGIVLNCPRPLSAEEIEQWAPAALITNLTQVPVLGTLPYLTQPESPAALAQAVSDLNLEALLPALEVPRLMEYRVRI
ncbi:MAG: dethiobiotin synthase [Nodosilinea sp.]